jgi:hypothetical protein
MFADKTIRHPFCTGREQRAGKVEVNPNLQPISHPVLESSEAERFKYVIGWQAYKLTKLPNRSAPSAKYLELTPKQVVYVSEMSSKLMYFLESLC